MAGDIYISFGADTSQLEASLAVAKAQVSSLAADFRDLTQEFVDSGASIDSDLGQQMVALGGKMNEAKGHALALKQELKGVGEKGEGEEERLSLFERMKESMEAMVSPIVMVRDHLGELVEIFAAAFAVEKIAEWAAETSEAAENIERESAKLGVSIEQIESLQSVAKLTGTDYGELAMQFEKLQLSLSKVGEKATPASEALRVLGLNAAQLRGQSLDQQIETLAGAFSRFADGPAKTAAAMALLGKTGADMIPFLDKGKEGMEDLRQVAERTGVVLSGELIESMAQTREHISELSLAWTAASREIYAAFNPAIDALVQALNRFLEKLTVDKIREWTVAGVQGFGALSKAAIDDFEELRAAIDTVIVGFERMWSVVASVSSGVSTAIKTIANAIQSVSDALTALQHGSETAAMAEAGLVYEQPDKGSASPYGGLNPSQQFNQGDIADQFRQFQFEAALNAQRLKKGVDDYTKSLSELFVKSKDDVTHAAEGGGAKPNVPAMDLAKGGGAASSKEAQQAVRDAYEQDVRAAKDAADEEQETLKRKLDFHQITMAQWLAQSVAALDKEQDAIQDAADKAMASDQLTAHEKQRIALQEHQDIAQIAKKIAEDQDKAAKDTQKSWDQAFNAINGAFDSQINGLLRGTTSWAQAFKNVLASLIEDLTKFFVNWGLKAAERFVEDNVMNTARVGAHVTGNATMAASDAASAAAGGLAWAGNALKAIAADAAQAFGGVFAFLAPVLGPAAAGPAAGASASVLAAGAAVASADIGMWQVPADMLSLVHHNELIMPAAQAAAFRDMLSSGGGGGGQNVSVNPSTHFHVSAVDGASVSQFFRNNQRGMMRAVDEAVRHGAHLGLRRIAPA